LRDLHKIQTGNWQDAAEKLNGFNREDIGSLLAKLTLEEVGFIHQGAVDNPRVGPDSNVAKMTAPGTDSRSNAAAGAGGGRRKGENDPEDDPRADERSKKKQQQERRQQRQEKAEEGRDMDKCSELRQRVFDSKDAIFKAIREELLPEAVEGNTPSTTTGNDASHPVRHIGVYTDQSKKKYAGTIFSQRCLDDKGEEKVVWTTNIGIRKEATQSKNVKNTQDQVAVSAKPVITDLHSGLTSSIAILLSKAKLAFPQVQPGSEFFITTSPEIVEKYLNPLAKESFRKLASVNENRQFRAERTFHVVALGIFGAGMLVAIAVSTGAGGAGGAAGATGATGATGAGGTALAPVIPFLTKEVLAAAAALTLVLRSSEAGAGEPLKERTVGKIKITPATLIGSQPRSIGSAIIVGTEKMVIVGSLVMQ
jgi:hypothetical protein